MKYETNAQRTRRDPRASKEVDAAVANATEQWRHRKIYGW